MAQFIRRYSTGSTINRQFATATDPNVDIFGDKYSKDTLVEQVLGKDYLEFKNRLNLNTELEEALDLLVELYTQGIADGRLTFHKDKIRDEEGEYFNTGKLVQGKNLTDEEIANNLSIYATSYLVDRFSRKKPFLQSPVLDKYTFNLEKALGEDALAGFSYAWWETLDPKNLLTGERSTTNRAKKISEALEKESQKLYSDIDYRNKFSWGGEDFAESQQKARNAADYLYLLSKSIKDGKIDDTDMRYISLLGLDALFEKLLNIETPESKKKKQEEAAKQQLKQLEQQNYRLAAAGKGFVAPKYPWEAYIYYDANGNVSNNFTPIDLLNINSHLQQFDLHSANIDGYLDVYAKAGYNLVYDVTNLFEGNPQEALLFQNGFNGKTLLRYVAANGSTVDCKNLKTFVSDGKDYLGLEANGQKFHLPLKPQALYSLYILPYTVAPSVDDSETLMLWLTQYFNSGMKDYSRPLVTILREVISKGSLPDDSGTFTIPVSDYGSLNILLTDVGLQNFNANRPLNSGDIRTYLWISSNKKGGVIKAQQGLPIGFMPRKISENTSLVSTSTVPTDEESVADKKPKQQADLTLQTSDRVRLGAAIADLTSAIGSFVPGLNIASSVVGVGSSFAEFGSDLYDLANNRKDAQSLGSAALELLGNVGMDLVSIVPFGKSAKVAKSLRTIASFVPHVMGALYTGHIALNKDEREAFLSSMDKLNRLDFSNMDTKDIHNITFAVRSLLGAKHLKNQVYDKISSPKSSKSTITGTVKIGEGDYRKVSAVVDNNHLGIFKSKNKAKEFLAKAANDDHSINKPVDDSGNSRNFTKDDVDIDTSFGVIKSTKVYPEGSSSYTAKNVFEGTFGSKGLNWAISDKNLSNGWLSNFNTRLTKANKVAHDMYLNELSKSLRGLSKMATDNGIQLKKPKLTEDIDKNESLIYKYKKDIESLIDKSKLEKALENLENAEGKEPIVESNERAGNRIRRRGRRRKQRGEYKAFKDGRDDLLIIERALGSNPTLLDRYKRITTIDQLNKFFKKHKASIIQAFKDDPNNTLAQLKGNKNYYSDIDQSNIDLGTNYEKYFTKFKLKHGGLVINKYDIAFLLMNLYRNGGQVIPKFTGGGTFDGTPYYDYDDENTSLYYDGLESIYDIFKETYDVDYEGYNYPAQGANSGLRVDGLDSFDWLDRDTQQITRNLTLDDIEKVSRNYKSSGKWKEDLESVYQKWTNENPDKSAKDFAKWYNDNVFKLYKYSLQKHSLDHPYNINSLYDEVSEHNELFNTLYPNLTKYEPTSFSTYGSSSFVRFPLYFDLNDGELTNEDNRTFNLGDSTFVVDTKGFLRTEGLYDDVDEEDDEEDDSSDEYSFLYSSELKGKTKTKFDPNKGLLGDLANLATTIAGNSRQLRTLKDLKPVFKAPTYEYNVVRGDVMPILLAEKQAGTLMSLASLPVTSDLAVLRGTLLSSYVKGQELVDKAISDNTKTYNASVAADLLTRNKNIASEVSTANDNAKAAIAQHNNRIVTKNALLAANAKAYQDFIKGITSDIKNVDKLMLNQDSKAVELSYKSRLSQAALMFESELMTHIKSQEQFIDNYKELNKITDISGVSDTDLKRAFFQKNPSEQKRWEQKWTEIESKISKWYLDQTKGILKRSYPYNWITGGLPYDILSDEVPQNKKGGSLTSQDKLKMLALKDFNKSLREDAKLFNKNARESQKEFNKMLKELSKTSLTLLKTAMQI